jgi:hypothetical protein
MVNFQILALLALAISASQAALVPRAADAATQAKNAASARSQAAAFAKLTPASPCQAGQNACVKGSFAQCVGNKFALTKCAGNTSCQVLPLLNSLGTSITCTTAEDAAQRIKNAENVTRRRMVKRAADAATQAKNAASARQKAAEFALLTPDTPCANGPAEACVKGAFAQCVGNKFALTNCAGGSSCQVLPLLNSLGTSITCSTPEDAAQRIKNAENVGGVPAAVTPAPVAKAEAPVAKAKAPVAKAEAPVAKAKAPVAKAKAKAPVAKAAAPNQGQCAGKSFKCQNGLDALSKAAEFQKLTATSPCATVGETVCVGKSVAICGANNKLSLTACNTGLSCQVLPLVNAKGTSVTCDTVEDAQARIKAALASN